MIVLSEIKSLKQWRSSLGAGLKIAFVPTMGALHEGHISLLKAARQNKADLLIVSIFVNPLQFGPNEDLSKYPRTLEKDLEICRNFGVDLVFTPSADELYPEGLAKITRVIPPPEMANCLCGLARPGHFEGVLTIVLKLFNLICPTMSFFGEKDFQQLFLIKKMVQDLNLNIEIVPCPTIRTETGLALSSRNAYLNEAELLKAAEIQAVLQQAADSIKAGKPVSETLSGLKQTNFEYFEARNPENLQISENLPLRLLLAAKVGSTRLIDNIEVKE